MIQVLKYIYLEGWGGEGGIIVISLIIPIAKCLKVISLLSSTVQRKRSINLIYQSIYVRSILVSIYA